MATCSIIGQACGGTSTLKYISLWSEFDFGKKFAFGTELARKPSEDMQNVITPRRARGPYSTNMQSPYE